jgi:hypothetical protein
MAPKQGYERSAATRPLKRPDNIGSKPQNERSIKANAARGLALHELGLILVMIGALIDIVGVLCMPPGHRGTIGHTQASTLLAAPASKSPVK